MNASSERVLMIYLEPAPYVVGFIEDVRKLWNGAIDVAYCSQSLTQNWGHSVRGANEVLLPPNRAAFAAIRALLAKRAYSLVHLAGWGHPALLRTLLFAAWKGIPTVVESDTPRPFRSPLWKRWIKRVSYPLLFRLPSMFVPGGMAQASYLRDYGVKDSRIRVVNMTADVEKIAAYSAGFAEDDKRAALQRYGMNAEQIRFLYVGRLEPYKGVRDLLAAFDQITRERQDIALVVVGDGSLRNDVVSAAANAPSVHYLGFLSGEKLWEAYNLGDVFILPSHSESWGLAVNEAMAAALPVIVTDRVGCVQDLVRHGRTGLIVEADCPEALGAAMRKMANIDATTRLAMRTETRHVIGDWTLRNQAAKTVAAWRNVLR